jgi:energy-coupling factor transport system substrate-specific component
VKTLNWGLITVGVACLAVLVLLFRVEKKSSFNARQISLMAALAAICAAGRAATGLGMLFLQPTMFIVEIVGYVMGARIGFFVGAMAPFISNFFMGQGSWTPFQMICWGLVGVSGAVLRKVFTEVKPVYLTAVCFVWGYLYGAIMDIYWVPYINQQLTLKTFFLVWLAGFSFDSLRALGNLFFCALLGAQVARILEYYQKKLQVEYLESID